MSWVHDTRYEAAYDHEGRCEPVLSPESGGAPVAAARADGAAVIGWRAVCACGWRSPVLHRRSDHPVDDRQAALAPDSVEDLNGPAEREWSAHLHRALPDLAAHDAGQHDL